MYTAAIRRQNRFHRALPEWCNYRGLDFTYIYDEYQSVHISNGCYSEFYFCHYQFGLKNHLTG